MPLQALLWDVDGTIAETERDGHRVAFNRAFRDEGLAWGWSEGRYRELLAITGGRERILADMANQPGAPMNFQAREQLASRLHAAKNRHYAALVTQGHIRARPGVLALMREARAAGLRQGIATTTSRANVQALMTCLLGPDGMRFFDVVLCAEDTERKKPDPEVYQRALHRLRLAASEALALEDSGPGVTAALGAGLPVLWRAGADSPMLPPAQQQHPDVLACPTEDSLPSLEMLRAWHRVWCTRNGQARKA